MIDMKESVKNREILYKSVLSQVKDIDEKGMVVFYGSVFGTPDKVKDIVERGAYKKTISEGFKEIQHYKNHDSTLMPGVLHELSEDNYGLLAKSKLILGTQLGRETYEEYKAMAEAGKSMGHSIGYATIREDADIDGYNHLRELKLFELSSLTKRAAHSDALTVDIKSFSELDFDELIKEETFYNNLLKCRFTDAKLEQLEAVKNHISALIDDLRRKQAPELIIEPLTKDEILTALIGSKNEFINALKNN